MLCGGVGASLNNPRYWRRRRRWAFIYLSVLCRKSEVPAGLVLPDDVDPEEAAEAARDADGGDAGDDEDAAAFASYRADVGETLGYLCFFLERPGVEVLYHQLRDVLHAGANVVAAEAALFCVAAGGTVPPPPQPRCSGR